MNVKATKYRIFLFFNTVEKSLLKQQAMLMSSLQEAELRILIIFSCVIVALLEKWIDLSEFKGLFSFLS